MALEVLDQFPFEYYGEYFTVALVREFAAVAWAGLSP